MSTINPNSSNISSTFVRFEKTQEVEILDLIIAKKPASLQELQRTFGDLYSDSRFNKEQMDPLFTSLIEEVLEEIDFGSGLLPIETIIINQAEALKQMLSTLPCSQTQVFANGGRSKLSQTILGQVSAREFDNYNKRLEVVMDKLHDDDFERQLERDDQITCVCLDVIEDLVATLEEYHGNDSSEKTFGN